MILISLKQRSFNKVCANIIFVFISYKNISNMIKMPKTVIMVDKTVPRRSYSLEEVLTEEHVQNILQKHFRNGEKFEVIGSEAKPATEGIAGFLADHMRVILIVKYGDQIEKINLFVKRIPVENKPKAEFIDDNNYFKREKFIFQLLDEMKGGEGTNPWCAKSYVQTDSLVVMPDLSAEGYILRPSLETLDLQHVMLTVKSIARFHAAFANYETNKAIDANHPFDFYSKYGHILSETTFQDTPWVRTAAKLTANLLDAFSTKYRKMAGLEEKLAKLYVQACLSLNVAEGSLNVVVHKDLWNNNILFKYENGEPINALLIDYQCVRYGPPTFDVSAFLYLNTTRKFREENESQIFKHYYETFSTALEHTTKKRLDALGYDEEHFLNWCEKTRMFGLFEAIGILPQVLMDASSAEQVFDDPETFLKLVEEDRSGPVITYAKKVSGYRERNLEVSEEFVERYVLEKV